MERRNLSNLTPLSTFFLALVAGVFSLSVENDSPIVQCTCTGYSSQWQPCSFSYDCGALACQDCENTPAIANSTKQADSVLILRWNSHFDDIAFYRQELAQYCSIPCVFTDDKGRLPDADAVLFSIIYSFQLPAVKYSGQKYVAHCQESRASYFGRNLNSPSTMSLFDITATYLRSSDIWVSYFQPELFLGISGNGLPPVHATHKNSSAPVVWVASNCDTPNNRVEVVRELMKYINIDSYGACLHNKDFPFEDNRHHPGYSDRKTRLLAQYKFTLAFESSISTDYVTEKFFQPLRAGSVPVVFGAPNVRDFAPSNHSYIDVTAFPSVAALGEYLQVLDKDNTLFEEYQSWRRRGWTQEFFQLVHTSYHTAPCRVCRKVWETRLQGGTFGKGHMGLQTEL